jgi:integrase
MRSGGSPHLTSPVIQACGPLVGYAGCLEVRRTLQRVNGQLCAVTPKTFRSHRTVPLIGVCIEALRAHRDRQEVERDRAGAAWQNSGDVFRTQLGTPIEPDNLRRSWYPVRSAAGLDGVRFHGPAPQLRDAAARVADPAPHRSGHRGPLQHRRPLHARSPWSRHAV